MNNFFVNKSKRLNHPTRKMSMAKNHETRIAASTRSESTKEVATPEPTMAARIAAAVVVVSVNRERFET